MARNGMVEPASDSRVLHAPWDFETTELSEGMCSTVYDARGTMVADYLTEDRARLIAAAPELLAALTEGVNWIDRLCVSEDIDPQHIRAGLSIEGATLASALRAFRAAITKATTPVSR